MLEVLAVILAAVLIVVCWSLSRDDGSSGWTYRGYFTLTCRNADGTIAWRRIVYNGLTTEGANHILGVEFNSVAQITTWHIGLIDNASFSALAAADTMASHAGWIEVTAYSEGVRQTWTPLSVSGGACVNTSLVAFSINATKTIKGMFLTSDSAKSGTAGKLIATAAFDQGNQSMSSGQTLDVTYTNSIA